MAILLKRWGVEVLRLLVVLSLSLWAGFWLGFLLAFLIGISLYAVWHLYQLFRLERWLHSNRGQKLLSASGIWAQIFEQISLIRLRNRRRKKRLARISKKFNAAIGVMPDPTLILNSNFEVEWCNNSSKQLLGIGSCRRQNTHKKKSGIGKSITKVLPDQDFARYLKKKNVSKPLGIPIPNREDVTVSSRLVPFAKKQYLMVAVDVTEMNRINAIRRDFVNNTSHELRTPLTVLVGYLENMAEANGEIPQQWQTPVRQMRRQSTRMLQIVEDMLMLARLEQKEDILKEEEVDVPLLLQGIREEAEALGKRLGVQQEIVFEIQNKLWLRGDGRALQTAFSNLIFNAVKYTQDGGKIEVRWLQSSDQAIFEVEDNGSGIPAEHLGRLTERFYRVDTHRSREQGGTGLGLSIVRHVVERHDGQLDINSLVGVGSRFSCMFPASRVFVQE